jgi:hypothetical protein
MAQDEFLSKFGPQVSSEAKKRSTATKNAKYDVPTEHAEQVKFFKWAEHWLPENMQQLIFAIPNGGARHVLTGKKLKDEGVKPGVPDIFFAWPRLGYHGMFIEMKRKKGGRLSESQKFIIDALRSAGYFVVVCKGCEEAQKEICNYMLGKGGGRGDTA